MTSSLYDNVVAHIVNEYVPVNVMATKVEINAVAHNEYIPLPAFLQVIHTGLPNNHGDTMNQSKLR